MWELKTAADLRPHVTYVHEGGYHASAATVTSDVVPDGDAVAFRVRSRWSRTGTEQTVSLEAVVRVYILTCTCDGMAFICNRWVFTGECRCVHHPLPKEGT